MALPVVSRVCAIVVIFAAVFSFQTQGQQQEPGSFGFRKLASWPGVARGVPTDIVVEGNTAYIAMEEGGICIVDVTTRSAPRLLSRLDLPGSATRVKLDGNFLYVTCGTAGLQIVNVIDPANPTLASSFDTDGTTVGVGIAHPWAFIADSGNGVVIADISNPSAPTQLNRLALPGIVYDVSAIRLLTVDTSGQPLATNRYFQVANGTNGLLAYSMTNATQPRLIFHDTLEGMNVRALDRWGRNVYSSDGSVVTKRDFTRLSAPVAGYWFTDIPSSMPITRVVVGAEPAPGSGGFGQPVYAFSGVNSYTSVWIGNNPPVSAFKRPHAERAVADVGDGFQYYVDIPRGLTIYQGNTLVGSLAIGGEAQSIRVGGDRVYVGDQFTGLETLTVAGDGTLTHRSTYPVWNLVSFDVSGSNVVILGNTNAEIVNVQNAAQPTRAANITGMITNRANPGFVGSVTASNNVVFIGTATYGLAAIGMTNPSAPALLRKSQTVGSTPFAMRFSGTNIIAADRNGILGLSINPNFSTTVRQHLVTGQATRDIEVVGTTAYLCDRANGLKIYDVTNPGSMQVIGTYDTPGSAYGVAISGNFAFVADQGNGILVLNVSDAANPTLVASLALEHTVFDLQVRSNRLFLAHGAEGVTVWDLIPKKAQTLDFPAIADKTVRDPSFALTGTASSGLPVVFSVVSGPAEIQNGRVTLKAIGTVTIRASQAGNDEFAAVHVDRTFAVARATQTINFAEITEKTTRSAPFQITAISDSGLRVRIFVVSGLAEIEGGVGNNTAIVTTTGAGLVTIRAAQEGDADWFPATVERTFTVIEVPREIQVVTMPLLTDGSIEDDPIYFVPMADSNLPLEVAVTGAATLDGFGMLTMTGLGEVSVSVTQAGDRDFAPVNIQKVFQVRDLASAVTANVLARNPNLPASATLPDADADSDGLPNIVEYILRTDPTSGSSMEGHTTATIHESGGARYLKARYLKPRTLKYPVGIQVTDFADYPNLTWLGLPAGFNDDGTGEFLWPVANYRMPVIRLVVRYP